MSILAKNINISVEYGVVSDGIEKIYEGGVGSSICLDSFYSKYWKEIHKLTDGDFHPVKFYNYHPNISIAYLRMGKKILARTLLYSKNPESGRINSFGPMYYDDIAFARMLFEMVEETGAEYTKNPGWVTTRDFEINGTLVDPDRNLYVCPFPYLDLLRGFKVAFDQDTKKFKFGGKYSQIPGSKWLHTVSHFGYINNETLNMPSDDIFSRWG